MIPRDLFDNAGFRIVDQHQVVGGARRDMDIVPRESDAPDGGREAFQDWFGTSGTVRCLPDFHLGILARGGEQVAIGTESEVVDRRTMRLGPLLGTVGHLEPSQAAIGARGVDRLATVGIRQAGDRRGVPREHLLNRGLGHIDLEQQRLAVAAARRHLVATRVPGHRGDRVRNAVRHHDRLAGGQIPESHRLVGTPRDQFHRVRMEGECLHSGSVARQLLLHLACRQFDNGHLAIRFSERQQFLVGTHPQEGNGGRGGQHRRAQGRGAEDPQGVVGTGDNHLFAIHREGEPVEGCRGVNSPGSGPLGDAPGPQRLVVRDGVQGRPIRRELQSRNSRGMPGEDLARGSVAKLEELDHMVGTSGGDPLGIGADRDGGHNTRARGQGQPLPVVGAAPQLHFAEAPRGNHVAAGADGEGMHKVTVR